MNVRFNSSGHYGTLTNPALSSNWVWTLPNEGTTGLPGTLVTHTTGNPLTITAGGFTNELSSQFMSMADPSGNSSYFNTTAGLFENSSGYKLAFGATASSSFLLFENPTSGESGILQEPGFSGNVSDTLPVINGNLACWQDTIGGSGIGVFATKTDLKINAVAPIINNGSFPPTLSINAIPAASVLANTSGSSATPSGSIAYSTSGASTSSLKESDANANVSANNFIANYTTTAASAGTTTLTVSSNYLQYFTGTAAQTIVLPVASTLVDGFAFEIVNNTTQNLTVNSSGGNLVQTVLSGYTLPVY
jgi:hypothetical protein